MYINKIDDLIDKVIDDFYANIMTDVLLPKILKEVNFVKFQKEINAMIINFVKTINLSEIKELVKSNDAVHTISETLKRYVAFYLFLTIGFNYTSKNDSFINNVVEFTKNQPEFNFKIDNFFNSESNSLLIKYNDMIHNILTLLDADQAKIDILKVKPNYKDTILFLNDLGGEYISKNFMLNETTQKKDQCHNIIKTIIILLLYKVTEKKDFFRLLEMTENLDGEYMFIDIVIPKQKYIDFNSVEQLIGSSPAVKNLSYYLWNFVVDFEESLQKPPVSIEEKLVLLIESGILCPISDDFLLYHKESERYDRISDPNKVKKKEDTKIRYIINKIDTTSEYYSEQIKKDDKARANIKKNFYVPLYNRKAITVNHNEDVNIINKFINQGKRSVENNEYFNDLINYKTYPYVNFKDFEKNGFSVIFPKTIDVVRAVSLNREGDFKQNSHNSLQLRVGSKDMSVNIVGFMIPTNTKPLQCLKTRDVRNLRDIDGKNENGYDLAVKYLRESMLGTEKHEASVYWMFDLDKDIVPQSSTEFEQAVKYTPTDQIKRIVTTLYDTLIEELYYMVLTKFEADPNLTLQKAYKILKMYESKLIQIPEKSEFMTLLEQKIYSLVKQAESGYDKKEDIVYGISTEVIKLPVYPGPEKKEIQLIKIDLSGVNEFGVIEEKEMVEGICQHNITWDKISSIHKLNPKLYTDELYGFIQQYVIENVDQELVCKSCGHQLNIKKYITDGVFDDDTQKFITFSTAMEIPLEDIPEYEKFKVSIRNIDKLIEKIASISNIPHLMRSSSNVKWKRKGVVKDVIDLLIANNAKLKPIYKERNEQSFKNYGISKDLTNLFVFELENSIFVFSSKDKDYYKQIKLNNIIAYMVYMIILEINDSHVPYLGGDRKSMCNFSVFDKIFYHLFEGLKIRTNSKGDLKPITDYKILCYLIYIIGCSAIKYNMWFYEQGGDQSAQSTQSTQSKKKKPEILIQIQKIFVHTVLDIINSVLEQSSQFDKLDQTNLHLYEMISIKTYKKLESTFKNEELYKRLKNDEKSSIVGEKKDFILTKKKITPLSGKFTPIEFDDPIRRICKLPRMFIDKLNEKNEKYYTINNITNCPDGQFHIFTTKNGHFECSICGKKANDLVIDEKESKVAISNFKFVRLGNLAVKFCLDDGTPHQFSTDNQGISKCLKCGNGEKHIYSEKELLKLESVLDNEKKKENEMLVQKSTVINQEIQKEISYVDKVVNHVKKAYSSTLSKGHFSFIDELINEIQSIVGNEIKSGENKTTYLKENSYVIDHDHLGYALDKNVVLTDIKNKIMYKQNHPFFNTDVIYYTSYKNGKIEIFYDATTRILLGYKEESRNYVLDKKQDKRLIINYSIFNKLKMLGHQSQFINIEPYCDEIMAGRENIESFDTDVMIKNIISDLIRERVMNLKKVITEFQRLFFKILNNYGNQTEDNVDNHSSYNKTNFSFIEKQKKNLANINIFDNNGNHMIFKHWKGVVRGIYSEEIKDYKQDFTKLKIINSDDLNKIDNNGNIILYFITSELSKLIRYNSNNFTKLATVEFVIDFINNVFDLFNNEKIISNIDVKRFSYILSSVTYIQEVSEKNGMNEIEGIYEEHQDVDKEITQEEREEIIDLEEEQEGFDMENDPRNEESSFAEQFESTYERYAENAYENA